jgi:hypothetical protein
MITLPVSRLIARLRMPDGADEILLMELDASPLPAALGLLNRLAAGADGAARDWAGLPVTDFEFLLLKLRVLLLGDFVAGHAVCPACREPADISFRISDYLASSRPAAAPAAAPAADENGWMRFNGAEFRLPVVADVLAALGEQNPEAALAARCVRPGLAGPARRRVERLLEKIAAPLTGPVGGDCPSCGAVLTALFDVPAFVVRELRRLAAGVLADVHLLASAYHWREAAILALPGMRRRIYADFVRSARLETI